MPILKLATRWFVRRGDRFFDLLEASAEEGRQASRSLVQLVEQRDYDLPLHEFVARHKQDKRLREEMVALLCRTFVTPMDREDLDALSAVLARIPKVIKKFAERLYMLRQHVDLELFRKQAELSAQATDTLLSMVQMLRSRPQLGKIREANDKLHRWEAEADKLILQLYGDLYGGRYTPLQMIVLRDLHELLEKVIDRCRDAGNQMFQIVLKYS